MTVVPYPPHNKNPKRPLPNANAAAANATANAQPETLNRYQRQQLARLVRADRWIFSRAERSLDRGNPLYRVYRRLRRGLIAVLRAALFEAGDKRAGGYCWADLLVQASAQLPVTAAACDALPQIAAMPYRPQELPELTNADVTRRYLATLRPYQSAAHVVQQWAAQLAAPAVGIREGRWLRRDNGQTCLLLRWNGVRALLGAVGERPGLIETFDLLRAMQKRTVQWIDDAQEIQWLQARLVSPLPKRYWAPKVDDSDIEEIELQDALALDPDRAAMVLLLKTDIAGLPYHQSNTVTTQLKPGLRLHLLREPDNHYDTQAVAVVLTTGEKLGYVPRRCNAGIARRLDDGVALGVWLTRVVWARRRPPHAHPLALDIELRSADPADVPRTDVVCDDDAEDAPVSAPAPRPACSYWQVNSVFQALSDARSMLRHGEFGKMLERVHSAYNWGQQTWLLQHQQIPVTGYGIAPAAAQFKQATRASGLGYESEQLLQELVWRCCTEPSTARNTAMALCLLRIELLWQQHLVPFDNLAAVARARASGVNVDLPKLAPSTLPALPVTPLAQRYTPLRRMESLHAMRRLLRVGQRLECGLRATTADLRFLRVFNRDHALVRALLRDLAQQWRAQICAFLKPDLHGNCWEPDPNLPSAFEPLLPNHVRWPWINEAAELLSQAPPNLVALRTLQTQLFWLQPQTRRIGHSTRRVAKDHELFLMEQLLHCAQTLNMVDLVNGTCVPMPMTRRDALLTHQVWALFDALSACLFGRRRQAMLCDFPELLVGAAPPIALAITAWTRALDEPETNSMAACALTPEQAAAQTLLRQALMLYPLPWPADLANRIPALERLCPL